MPAKRPNTAREPFAGPESGPEPPFPIKLRGPIIKGFGRGSRELGIPTANIPPEGLSEYPSLESGVYYGFVGLSLPESVATTKTESETTSNSNSTTTTTNNNSAPTTVPLTTPSTPSKTYPAVLSIGYNPFYANKTRSVEIHILQKFRHDFYGAALNLLILGFIRPEYDYDSLDDLVTDIKADCEVAARSLDRDGYAKVKDDEAEWLAGFDWVRGVEVGVEERKVLGKDVDGNAVEDAKGLEVR